MALRLPGHVMGVLGLVLILAVGGCTYSREEPGLFRPGVPSSAPLPPEPSVPGRPTNPDLPVAGETVWTSGEGLGLTTRFAVHAVRRLPGATVLDYSITPLSAPGLQPGDEPSGADLGLTRSEGNGVAVWLLDPARGRAYRSLAHVDRREFQRCLCTPLWAAQPGFRLGRTSLLQLTFPALPADLDRVDVLLANQAPVTGVPVTPVGQVPTAGAAVDLTRPPSRPPRGRFRSVPVPDLGGRLRVEVGVDEVLAAPGVTSLRWRLRAPVGVGYRVFALGPPVGGATPEGVPVPALNSADGPSLRAPGAPDPLPASWTTRRLNGRPGFECLCSELGLWARSLTQPDGTVELTTLFPGLPAGTRQVQVEVPGLEPVTVPVTVPLPASERLGPPVTLVERTWVYSAETPPPARTVDDWPTALPEEWQLPDYRGSVERVGPLPRG